MTKTYKVFIASLLTIFMAGCSSTWEEDMVIRDYEKLHNTGERNETETRRRVLLLYAAGHNNLGYNSRFIPQNIKDLKAGWLPGDKAGDNILLIYSHLAKTSSCLPSESYLIRLYQDYNGNTVADTLKTYDDKTISASASQLRQVLLDAKSTFHAASYGMIFSSHATGYLPVGFSSSYMFEESSPISNGRMLRPTSTPYIERVQDPSKPEVKSIGDDKEGTVRYEIDLRDFARGIPFKLDYIIFDACLMGGIEVAYELRGKCNRMAFSQAEILAEGFNYKTITQRLLQGKSVDLQGACEDYFALYDAKQGSYKSATVSLVSCDKTTDLADVCREIFAAHREGLAALKTSKRVQQFQQKDSNYSHFHFYDLESIAIEAGATEDELEQLRTAIGKCVTYKAHTEWILGEIPVWTYSGLSMYIPGRGGEELDKYYRTLKWNEATELVEYE